MGNILGKGENAGNHQLLLFPKIFSILPKTSVFSPICLQQGIWIWTGLKLSLAEQLNPIFVFTFRQYKSFENGEEKANY